MMCLDIRILLVAASVLAAPVAALAQPRPGDVFREYRWTKTEGDAGGALRVGGRLDYGGGPVTLPHPLDLAGATRGEVVIEKLLCHDGTRGLAISFNDRAWIEVAEAAGIPKPPWDYQHHIYPVVPVPLDHLHTGAGNQFRLKVRDEHPWNWPQNLIYGVHLRIYYDPAGKPHPNGRLIAPAAGEALGESAEIRVSARSADHGIRRVDFLGLYEDVNWEGDGRYRQWHYRYLRAVLTGHLGTATTEPYRLVWDTSWVPDQPQPVELAAWIVDETGLTYFTESVGQLKLSRPGRAVELCKPYGIPKKWVTRNGEKEEKFRVSGDPDKAVAARLVWSSWSPGYMNGIYVNGKKVFDREGPRYACFTHCIPLDVKALVSGENVLRTGATPKHDGKTVHGMEVNWPGIMVLIQYQPPQQFGHPAKCSVPNDVR